VPRECGPCGLCCKLLAIKSIGKPASQWCEHWDKDAGCAIYETRPDSCRKFACLWLAEQLPIELSPRRTGVVACMSDKGLILNEDWHARSPHDFLPAIKRWASHGMDVNIVPWKPENTNG